jgi:hypothetical protein
MERPPRSITDKGPYNDVWRRAERIMGKKREDMQQYLSELLSTKVRPAKAEEKAEIERNQPTGGSRSLTFAKFLKTKANPDVFERFCNFLTETTRFDDTDSQNQFSTRLKQIQDLMVRHVVDVVGTDDEIDDDEGSRGSSESSVISSQVVVGVETKRTIQRTVQGFSTLVDVFQRNKALYFIPETTANATTSDKWATDLIVKDILKEQKDFHVIYLKQVGNKYQFYFNYSTFF